VQRAFFIALYFPLCTSVFSCHSSTNASELIFTYISFLPERKMDEIWELSEEQFS
jgi:hypothetical protein